MITTIKVDKYGVEEYKIPLISLYYLIKYSNPPIKRESKKIKKDFDKGSVEKNANLESKHSRYQKREIRWPSS